LNICEFITVDINKHVPVTHSVKLLSQGVEKLKDIGLRKRGEETFVHYCLLHDCPVRFHIAGYLLVLRIP
jgi:hypothetical protein